MQRSDRFMQPVGPGIEKVVASAVRRAPAGTGPVLAWPLACGQTVANRTRAVDFLAGVLHVEVPDARWRNELQVLAPRYVATLNRYVAEEVKRIEFVVASRSLP